jgi:flavodoxin/ferredoxin
MNVTLFYFSQTGNTRRIARAMAEVFSEAGYSARTLSLKKALPEDALDADVIGVGSPCFSSQAPTPIKNFLRSLPPIPGKPAFVFATSGTAPGRVLYDLYSILRDKGAVVLGGFLTRGTVRHPAPCLYGRLPDRPNAEDLEQARRFAGEVVENLAAGRTDPLPGSRPDTFRLHKGFYDFVALISTDSAIRFLMPRPKLNPAACNQCRWCEFECPVHNIELHPYPLIGKECIRCYRCVNGCPHKAYEVDWRIGNLIIYALYNKTFTRWFGT